VIVSVRAVDPVGVYVTEHVAVPVVVPAVNVQGEVANVPVPLVVKPTVPVGGRDKPVLIGALSVTDAVQVVADPVLTDAGMHVRVVVVGRAVAVRIVEPVLP